MPSLVGCLKSPPADRGVAVNSSWGGGLSRSYVRPLNQPLAGRVKDLQAGVQWVEWPGRASCQGGLQTLQALSAEITCTSSGSCGTTSGTMAPLAVHPTDSRSSCIKALTPPSIWLLISILVFFSFFYFFIYFFNDRNVTESLKMNISNSSKICLSLDETIRNCLISQNIFHLISFQTICCQWISRQWFAFRMYQTLIHKLFIEKKNGEKIIWNCSFPNIIVILKSKVLYSRGQNHRGLLFHPADKI